MLSSASMAEPATMKKISSMFPDWSQLPEELLHLISKKLEDNCFDVVHARSVCSSWHSSFPFPSCLLRTSYSLPSFADFPYVSNDLCTLEKVHLFLFRVRTAAGAAALPSEYFIGGLGQDELADHLERPSPLQCSVKVRIQGFEPFLINMLDCQIIPLGYEYRMVGWNPEDETTNYKGVAVLPLNKEGEGEGEGEFVVLLNYTKNLLVLRSTERRWMRLEKPTVFSCFDVAAFRGRFCAAFRSGDIFIFDPYLLQWSPMIHSEGLLSTKYLIPSGNDELFLVEKFNPYPQAEIIDLNRFTCRVSRLDEEAGQWVVVSELGDRVLFLGHFGNVCCSAKDLPDGCGVSGNSILFTDELGNVTFANKYGVRTIMPEDELNIWRLSRLIRVTILNTFPVVALRFESHI